MYNISYTFFPPDFPFFSLAFFYLKEGKHEPYKILSTVYIITMYKYTSLTFFWYWNLIKFSE